MNSSVGVKLCALKIQQDATFLTAVICNFPCVMSCTNNLLQEGKLSLHSLTGYPTCEQARVYSTSTRQNVSSSSDLTIKTCMAYFKEQIRIKHQSSM